MSTADPARFNLLASAIAGRTLEVAPLPPGGRSWTDGFTVFVDAHDDPDRQLASVAVQSSLVGAGSLDDSVLRSLGRRPALTRRYLSIEGHRALAAGAGWLPGSVARLVDESVSARSSSPQQSLAVAKSNERIDEPPDVFGTIRPRQMQPRHDSMADGANGQGLSPTGREVEGEAQLADLDADGPDEADAPDPFSSPVGGGGGIGRLLKRLFSDARSTGGMPGADSATHRSHSARGGGRAATLSTTPTAFDDVTTGPGPRRVTYPEWDHRIRRYKPDWCTLVESEPTITEPLGFVPASTALRPPLARLGMDPERQRRQFQGDDVDIDAAVEAQVDRRTGSGPDDAVYIDTVRRKRELAVLLLLDISASAGEPSVTGVPVHDHQRRAAAALVTALYDLGDRVAAYGFRSQGRAAVHLVPLKRFDEPLDELVMLRMGGLSPVGYTRLGAAIRHGTAILQHEAGTSRRLLVVLSDGLAYDHGYDRAYGEADTSRALAEARRHGIGCLCLSIGASTEADALRRVFGAAAYSALPTVEQLPRVVGSLFRAAVRSAELQRKVWQRRARTRDRLAVERSGL